MTTKNATKSKRNIKQPAKKRQEKATHRSISDIDLSSEPRRLISGGIIQVYSLGTTIIKIKCQW